MTCTRCGKPILKGEKYWRPKCGPHHHACTKVKSKECGNCQFFEHMKTLQSGIEEGQCHFNPPQLSWDSDSLFPRVTNIYCWCGQFQPKSTSGKVVPAERI